MKNNDKGIKPKKDCNTCNKSKTLDKFYKHEKTKDGLENQCKECRKHYSSIYHSNNKKARHDYHKNHYEKYNYQKDYNINSRKKINKYRVKKYHSDKQVKLRLNISNRIREALNTNNIKKQNNTLEFIGCSIEFYKQYLESLFLPEFTWENHGLIWEIDHIQPCSKFDLEDIEQQKICFNYKNTRPIFKTTKIAESFGYKDQIGNRNKSNKII
jgi:hypothetical protein